MKRIICMILALLLIFSLTACGGDGGSHEAPTEESVEVVLSDAVLGCCGVWYQDPMHGGATIEVLSNGTCVIYGNTYQYEVVGESDTEVVLQADSNVLQIYLNPLGIPELHLSTDWDHGFLPKIEYWELFGKEWYSEAGNMMSIRSESIYIINNAYEEYIISDDGTCLNIMQDGQEVYAIALVESGCVCLIDQEDNEKMFYVGEAGGWDEPMDEETRLTLAYDKALNDFNAAISGRPVYDDNGNEIMDGPTLARYLYDQFVALGAYEDAADYLPLFKTRAEGIKTEHRTNYSYLGEVVYEDTFDYDIPDYDVFGRPTNRDDLFLTYGIYGSVWNTDRMTLVRDENGIVHQVNIETYERVTVDGEERRIEIYITANLEYNEQGLLVATHVNEQTSDGENSSYTTTIEYDSDGRLTRVYVPNVERGNYLANYTHMYLYDEDGNLSQKMYVLVPVSPEEDIPGLMKGYPFAKMVTTYHYDDRGLLEKEMHYDYDYTGGGDGATLYEYDEEGNLIKESICRVNSGFTESGYSYDEWLTKTEGLFKAKYYPTATGDTPTYDDWLVNVPIDLSPWDWIPHGMWVNSEKCYSYSKNTTIMYIDLTPED